MKRSIVKSLVLLLAVSLFYSYGFAADSKETGKPKYREGELLVKFKTGVPSNEKDNLHRKHGSEKIKDFPSLRIQHIKLKKGLTVDQAIVLYQADNAVEYAEPNYEVKALNTPDDTYFDNLWGLHNTGQTGGTADADIDAPEAWDIATGSSDVVVAVIDTGVDYNHEDLSANVWINAAEIPGNGIDDDGNGYVDDVHGIDACNGDSDPIDDHGHGTHVAGTIGAVGNNGIGIAGVNWNVKILPCKFLNSSGSGTISGAIECLQYIKAKKDSGVNVIATNNSWGGGEYSQALYDAINAQREILFIAAAGNAASDNDVIENVPSNYYLPNVVAVAATDHTDAMASFSNYGRRTVHVGAPGVDIVSLRAAGTNMYGDSRHFIPDGDSNAKYYISSGTSMATPHVSGLAALIKSQDTGRDWRSIKNLILSGGDTIASMSGSTVTGRRINAYRSLTCTDRPVFSILKYPSSVTPGLPETISALSINCADPPGPVTATTSDGTVITLLDDGIVPDLAAGDGIFTGTWTPLRNIEKLTFTSPGGTEMVVIPPLSITTGYLATRPVGVPYSQTLAGAGGLPPYTWSIASGSLPPGLTLNISTGEISGTPTAAGKFSLTVLVTESYQTTSAKELSITIYNENNLYPLWTKTYNSSGGSALAVAADESGNVYVTGISYNGYSDYLTVKYDPSGNVLWTRTYGSGYAEIPRGLAFDVEGNLYVTGYSYNGSNYDVLTVKYDPAGNILWTRTYDGGINEYAYGIAADRSGHIYLTGRTFAGPQSSQNNILTLKYDTAGNLIWSKSFGQAGHGDQASGIAVDGDNNIYMTGVTWNRTNPGDFITIKADRDGNELWTAIYDSGDEDFATGITVDGSGNVYVTGSSYNGKDYDYSTIKYNSYGNVLWNRHYSGNGNDYAEGIAIYGDRVYVTGSSWNGLNYDAVTVKYSSAGDDYGLKIHDSGANEYAYAITADTGGNIYVAGYDNGFLIIKYVDHLLILNTSLPVAAVNTSYSQTLIAVAGVAPYTWSITSGSLPPGLFLGSATGTISGAPSTAGTFNFTAQVRDAALNIATRDLSITVYNALLITTTSLAPGAVTVPYSQTLTASGGLMPYAWSLTSGRLPHGLTLNSSTGVISGTSLEEGTFAFTAQVRDANSFTSTRSLSITIVCNELLITTSSLLRARIGSPYSQTLAASGGLPPYAWSVSSGALPTGLSLNSSTGEISGSPTADGAFDFTLMVTDAKSSLVIKPFSIAVHYEPPAVTTLSMPPAVIDMPYEKALSVIGGLPPFTWSVASGALPNGLTLNAATGAITGTPTAAGTFLFSVQVTDTRLSSSVRDLSLTVSAVPSEVWQKTSVINAFGIAADANGNVYVTGSSNSGTLWVNYDCTTTKYDSSGNVVWTSTYDSPGGGYDECLSIAFDNMTGNIYAAGVSNNHYLVIKYNASGDVLWAKTYDAGGAKGIVADGAGNVVVTGYSSVNGLLTVKYDPSGNVLWTRTYAGCSPSDGYGVAVDEAGNLYVAGSCTYSPQYLTVKYDPEGNVVWAKTYWDGGYAHGIALDSSGNAYVAGRKVIKYDPSGNVLWTKPFSVSAQHIVIDADDNAYVSGVGVNETCGDYVTNKYDPDGNVVWSKTYDGGSCEFAYGDAIDVGGNVYVTGNVSSGSLTIKYGVAVPPTIETHILPSGSVGMAYNQLLGVSGGHTPYSWSVASGTLPAGLSLSATGTLSGTPTTAGAFIFTVQAADAQTSVATRELYIEVYEPFAITTSSLPYGATDTPFSATLAATGGSAPYTWSINSGSLPPGLSLNSSTGEISGTPSTVGDFIFTVKTTDASAATALNIFSIAIYAPLAIHTTSLPPGTTAMLYNQPLTASGGLPPYSWSTTSGSLPGGINLNSATGVISGTPSAAGNYSFIVQVGDYNGTATAQQLSISIDSCLNYPARIGGDAPQYHGSIQAAYNAAVSGNSLETLAMEVNESPSFDRPVEVTFRGGYDCGYGSIISWTTVKGTLTLTDGTAVIENVILQ